MTTSELIESSRPDAEPQSKAQGNAAYRTHAEIQQWLTEYLAFLLEEKPEAVNIELSFDSHGIDSAAAVSLVGDLENWLGLDLDPTIVYDYPSVPELTNFLVSQQVRGAA